MFVSKNVALSLSLGEALTTSTYCSLLLCSCLILIFLTIMFWCFMQSTVYRIVLLNGGLTEYEAVLAEYRNTEDNQV